MPTQCYVCQGHHLDEGFFRQHENAGSQLVCVHCYEELERELESSEDEGIRDESDSEAYTVFDESEYGDDRSKRPAKFRKLASGSCFDLE